MLGLFSPWGTVRVASLSSPRTSGPDRFNGGCFKLRGDANQMPGTHPELSQIE